MTAEPYRVKVDGATMELAARFAALNTDPGTKAHVDALVRSGYFRTRLVEALDVALNQAAVGAARPGLAPDITKEQVRGQGRSHRSFEDRR